MSLENRKARDEGRPLPWPIVGIVDVGINADPQEEEAAVYRNLEWIQSITPPEQPLHVRTAGKLGEHLLVGRNSTGGRFASLPLFTSNHEHATETLALLKGGAADTAIIASLRSFAHTVSKTNTIDLEISGDAVVLFEDGTDALQNDLEDQLVKRFQDGELMAVEKIIMLNTQFGKVRRQCTKEYKTEVVEKFIRYELLGLKPGQRVPDTAPLVEQIIGISFDEAGRAVRIRKIFAEERPWKAPVFPLIDMEFTRLHCQNYLRAFGMPFDPPRSACTFCPFHSDDEWLRLKQLPAEWARIVEVDYSLRAPGNVVNRGANQKLYLHRSCLPIDKVDFMARIKDARAKRALRLTQTSFFEECEGMCGN
jgi:hypothetical protein